MQKDWMIISGNESPSNNDTHGSNMYTCVTTALYTIDVLWILKTHCSTKVKSHFWGGTVSKCKGNKSLKCTQDVQNSHRKLPQGVSLFTHNVFMKEKRFHLSLHSIKELFSSELNLTGAWKVCQPYAFYTLHPPNLLCPFIHATN